MRNREIEEFLNNIGKDVLDDKFHIFFNKVLNHFTNSYLTDDMFTRWGVNKDNLLKVLREFHLDHILSETSQVGEAFVNRPDLVWTISRLEDNREGVQVFFKNFGVTDYENFLPKKGNSVYNDSYSDIIEDLKNKDTCTQKYTISNEDYKEWGEFNLRVAIVGLYMDYLMTVCKSLEILLDIFLRDQINIKVFPYSAKVANFKTEAITK